MNDKPVIQITDPEVIEKENEIIYDYDKSHVIYKMQDLGSFAELQKMKAVNQKYKEVFDKVEEYIKKRIDSCTAEANSTTNDTMCRITIVGLKHLLDILKQEE